MTHHLFPILWLTGNTGAGKTTLAEGLERHVNEELDTSVPWARRLIVLDGNAMRATISIQESFAPEDRRAHNLRVARLAQHLQSRGFLVVVAVIAPFASVREEIDRLCAPLWIHVQRVQPQCPERPYELPVRPALVIDTDRLSLRAAQQTLRRFVEETLDATATAAAGRRRF